MNSWGSRIYKVLILTTFIVGWKTPVHAQKEIGGIEFERIAIKGSFQFGPVTQITQDPNGLIWIATLDGLHRYDGYETFSLRSNPHDSLSLQENNIIGVTTLNADSLIVTCQNTGVFIFVQSTGHFHQLPTQRLEALTPRFTQTIIDSRGKLWVFSEGSGLYFWEKGMSIVEKYQGFNLLESLQLTSINLCPSGSVWATTKRAIYQIDGSKRPQLYLDAPESWKDESITSMLLDSKKNLWLGSDGGNISVFDQWKKKGEVPESLSKAIQRKINRIFEDKSGRLWLLTEEEGLLVYHSETETLRHFTSDARIDGGIASNKCLFMYQDKKEAIWVGTEKGLSKYDPFQRKFNYYTHDPGNPYSLSNSIIRSVIEDKEGQLWIGTHDGTINILNRANQTNHQVKLPGFNNIPFCFYDYNDDEMLVGAQMGLYRYDKSTGRINEDPLLNQNNVSRPKIRQIVSTPDRDIVYCLSETNIYEYNLKESTTRKLEEIKKQLTTTRHFGSGALFVDHKNRLWFGGENEVVIYEWEKDSIYSYKFFRDPIYSGYYVISIDYYKGKYWLGTVHGGLFSLEERQDGSIGIHQFTEKDGLPNSVVYASVPDNLGNIWISTNVGLSKFEITSQAFTNYIPEDGLQGYEFNRLVRFNGHNGELFFGGINGLNSFFPNDLVKSPYPLQPTILEVKLLNQYIESNSDIQRTINLVNQKEIRLNYDQNYLSFKFTTDHFGNVGRISYKYQLENYDKNWVQGGSNRTATYTGLKPGKYTFKVRAGLHKDSDPKEASILVIIEAPIWQQTWFIITSIGLVSALVLLTIRRRIRNYTKLNEFLKARIKTRTQELEKSQSRLSRLNKKKDFLFSILAHDLRSPLTTLAGYLDLLGEDIETLDKESIKNHINIIKSSVDSSLDLIDNTLYWSLSQMGRIKLTPEVISVNQTIEQVINIYELAARKKGLKITVDLKEEIWILADENTMNITFRNLISNAVKFTPSGNSIEITGHLDEEQSKAVIQIKDEGIGMDDETISKIFNEEEHHIQKGTSNEKGTGLGLSLCKKFMELNKGNLEVKSKPGAGSEFTLIFPMVPVPNKATADVSSPVPG